MEILRRLEFEEMRTDIPDFRPGDTVRVHVKIQETDEKDIKYLRSLGWEES